MNHSKGPWKLVQQGWDWQKVFDADDNYIATVTLMYDTAESNARLIAAAPELLEELKEMTMAWGCQLCSSISGHTKACERRTALIAKSETRGG